MLLLPNGNKCSEIAVHPKNWKTTSNLSCNWYISYRFYSPGCKPKQVIIKTMNEYKRVDERRAIVESVIKNEMDMLSLGYNPNLKKIIRCQGEQLNFAEALDFAFSKAVCLHANKLNIRTVLKGFKKSLSDLGIDGMKIGEVRRKHIRMALDNLSNVKKSFSDNNYNIHRKYISGLFKELVELEMIEFNPVKEIAKRKTVRRIKPVISAKERLAIDQHLRSKGLMTFRLYMRIFFHSGCRSSELLSVKAKDVNLKEGYFICTIQKGKQVREVKKTIKDISLRYWKLALKNTLYDDYIFSEGLKPGKTPINPHQITRRWDNHVKKELGITQGFYSLKHSHTTEVVDISDSQTAATINGHTSTQMVARVYDLKSYNREHERIKALTNTF